MLEESKYLALLQIVVSPETPVTVSSEVKILEILGVVSNPALVGSMQLALTLVPPSAPATLKGLIQLLSGLIKMNPKSTKEHHSTLAKLLADLESVPDVELTFGTFLPICETLLKDSHKKSEGKTD